MNHAVGDWVRIVSRKDVIIASFAGQLARIVAIEHQYYEVDVLDPSSLVGLGYPYLPVGEDEIEPAEPTELDIYAWLVKTLGN